jgi:uncharacterized membrane protein YeiH
MATVRMISPELLTPKVLTAIEVMATLAFALSGVIVGAQKRLDAVGVVVVAFLAAFGGGTLRDLLLDKRPFFWVTHVDILWLVLVLTAVCMMFIRQRHIPKTEKIILWPDTIGLGLFTATGAFQAINTDLPYLVVVLMGVITGVFGGVLRDIVCNEIPNAFKDHRPYALCAFIGGWAMVLAIELGLPDNASILIGALSTIALRAFAINRNISLPAWRL